MARNELNLLNRILSSVLNIIEVVVNVLISIVMVTVGLWTWDYSTIVTVSFGIIVLVYTYYKNIIPILMLWGKYYVKN